jgi:hypothetical protein
MAKETKAGKGKKSTASKATTQKSTRSAGGRAKKTTARPKSAREKAPEKPQPKEIPQPEKESLSSEERVKHVGDRLSEAADRGVDIIRDVFGKVKDFSIDATELTRLKVEIYRLKGDKERMLTVIGEKLWELKDSDKLTGIRSLFTDDFKKLEEINGEISKKEKAASKISL